MYKVYIKVMKIVFPTDYSYSDKESPKVFAQINGIGSRYKTKCLYSDGALKTTDYFKFASYGVKRGYVCVDLQSSRNQELGSLKIEFRWFDQDFVFIDWYKMKSLVSKQPFMCKLKIHITNNEDAIPFNAPLNESTSRVKGWEEPFLNLQPNLSAAIFDVPEDQRNQFSSEEEGDEEEEDNEQIASQNTNHAHFGTDLNNFQKSETCQSKEGFSSIFCSSKPLGSLKRNRSRVIDL